MKRGFWVALVLMALALTGCLTPGKQLKKEMHERNMELVESVSFNSEIVNVTYHPDGSLKSIQKSNCK